MPRMEGPDFICVGMPKAGTGWLYDQLEAHPDFWMPPVKELVYLNYRHPPLGFVDDKGRVFRRRRDRKPRVQNETMPDRRPTTAERLIHRDPLDERDSAFLRYASTGRGKPRDLEFYASLFQFKGGLLSGDITPPYCNLREDAIAKVAQRFPSARILLLVRDPIARAWSRICMAHEGGNLDTALLDNAESLRAFLQETHRVGGLRATAVCERWRKAAPSMAFQFFFFDEIAAAPEKIRRDILRFLGADPEKKSGAIPPDYNRKAKTKLEMTRPARDVLVDHFQDELKASADIFGGPACAWPSTYGL
jgi:hypothetical protein